MPRKKRDRDDPDRSASASPLASSPSPSPSPTASTSGSGDGDPTLAESDSNKRARTSSSSPSPDLTSTVTLESIDTVSIIPTDTTTATTITSTSTSITVASSPTITSSPPVLNVLTSSFPPTLPMVTSPSASITSTSTFTPTSSTPTLISPPQLPLAAPTPPPDPVLSDPTKVVMSLVDCGTKMKLSSDKLTVGTTEKCGWRSMRSSHGIVSGHWYVEVTYNHLDHHERTIREENETYNVRSSRTLEAKSVDGSFARGQEQQKIAAEKRDTTPPFVRLGWATPQANVEMNVGADKHGYCYASKTGSKFHDALPINYGEPYTYGDTIGLYIALPTEDEYRRQKEQEEKDKLEKEEKEKKEEFDPYGTKKKKSSKPSLAALHDQISSIIASEKQSMLVRSKTYVLGSYIMFTKNGISQGIAYTDVYKLEKDECYLPTVSIYQGASCTVNFGPNFRYLDPSLADRLKLHPPVMTSNPHHTAAAVAQKEKELRK